MSKRLLNAFFSLWRYSPRRSLFAWRDTFIFSDARFNFYKKNEFAVLTFY